MTLVPLPAFADNYISMLQDGRNAIVVDPAQATPAFKNELAAILVTHNAGRPQFTVHSEAQPARAAPKRKINFR